MKQNKILAFCFIVGLYAILIAIPQYFMWPKYFDEALIINATTTVIYLLGLSFLIIEISRVYDDVHIPRLIKNLANIFIVSVLLIFIVSIIITVFSSLKKIVIAVGFIILLGVIISMLSWSIYTIFKKQDI